MAHILRDLEGVVCFMDDVFIYSRTQEEHDHRLYRVLKTIQSAGMTLNKAKCQFSQRKILFLGQLIDETGIKPDPAKILAIQTMPTP